MIRKLTVIYHHGGQSLGDGGQKVEVVVVQLVVQWFNEKYLYRVDTYDVIPACTGGDV